MRLAPPWLLALALALVAAPVQAASPVGPATPLTFRFEPLDAPTRSVLDGDAFVDIGTVTAQTGAQRRRGIVVRQRVAVRLDGRPGTASSARVSVALSAETPGCTVRLNGVPVTTLPRLIDPVHRVGAPVVYEIEMTIPPSVPAGPLLSSIQWFAETD